MVPHLRRLGLGVGVGAKRSLIGMMKEAEATGEDAGCRSLTVSHSVAAYRYATTNITTNA